MKVKKIAGKVYRDRDHDDERIKKVVNSCVQAMGELTIEESKIARKHLDDTMEEMYKRSPDTLIKTIQPLR
ncbi:MAG: hypothetical protein ACRDBO_15805 [Lachnospiraceae bacterium]